MFAVVVCLESAQVQVRNLRLRCSTFIKIIFVIFVTLSDHRREFMIVEKNADFSSRTLILYMSNPIGRYTRRYISTLNLNSRGYQCCSGLDRVSI